MAHSYSHKFGQIIGDLLELAIQPHLEKFAKKNKLYLDKKGNRSTRKGKRLTWIDLNGNKHDLDYVFEKNGNENRIGTPVAFIETAWRSYTKHARNKAQEIQGAILPLCEKHQNSSPFKGVVLAGVFTKGALDQLKSCGFKVLFFSKETVVNAFNRFGINADFNEGTKESEFKKRIKAWEILNDKSGVAKELLRLNKKEVDIFFDSLDKSIKRFIEEIILLPLFGLKLSAKTIIEAIEYLNKFSESGQDLAFVKYEVIIRYNNGDKIEASFKNKDDLIVFLRNYE
jgi:hypothetical protein